MVTGRALTSLEIRLLGKYDSANRWYPDVERVKPYFSNIRAPSRAWPLSYLKAASTKKFAKWLVQNEPLVAVKIGLMPDRPYWLVRANKVPPRCSYIEEGKVYVCYDMRPSKDFGFIGNNTFIRLDAGCAHLEGGLWEILSE